MVSSTSSSARQTPPRQKPMVILDLAPLTHASAFQGIGRYLRELVRALLLLSDLEAQPFRIVGLDRSFWPWRLMDLHEAWESFSRPRDGRSSHRLPNWRHCVAGLWLEGQGVTAYHQAEPAQTPFDRHVRVVLTYHDIIPIELWKLYSRRAPTFRRALNWLVTKWRLAIADHVITDSFYVAHTISRLFAYPWDRLTPIWIGVAHERFNTRPTPNESELLRQRWGLTGPYWLFVGTGDRRKNLPFLLEAVTKGPPEVPVVLVGKLHPLQLPPIERAIEELGLGHRVRRLGFVEDELLPALYRQSLALLFPSLAEGFGLPVVEAMACGTPVVAFANTSIPEVAGDAAWLVPTNDLEAFAEAMKVLAEKPAKRRELAEKGLERAKLFSWENTARSVLAVYRKVLGLAE